jgi:hypothetical protein
MLLFYKRDLPGCGLQVYPDLFFFLCKGSCIRKGRPTFGEKLRLPRRYQTFHPTMGTALEDFNATQFTVYSPK